jgi:hypothetical protein
VAKVAKADFEREPADNVSAAANLSAVAKGCR